MMSHRMSAKGGGETPCVPLDPLSVLAQMKTAWQTVLNNFIKNIIFIIGRKKKNEGGGLHGVKVYLDFKQTILRICYPKILLP